MTATTRHLGAAPVVDPDLGAASWRALGTYVDLRTTLDAVVRAAAMAVDVLDEVDAVCSRFRQDSDLSRANRAAGRALEVSPVLVGAVRVALEAAEETDGIVDPTLGKALAAAGYDRTFALVPTNDPGPSSVPEPRGAWRAVQVTDDRVCVPSGSALDLGATGKAFAADLVALAITHALDAPVLVSVGGDVRVACPDGEYGGGPAYPVVLGHSLADLAAGGQSTREQAAQDLAHALAEAEAARAHHEALLEWAADNPVVVTMPRPVRTVLGPEILVGASSPGSAEVGGSSTRSSGGGSGTVSRPAPPPAPPATSAAS
ncbi:MAG: FAD:protein FMN transferase, partial [Intrasporangiaceae bacterium]|nr:FAD:protein FMN transferase [Intrasporangiaceae bacterium]